MRRKKPNHEYVSILFTALMQTIRNATKSRLLALIFLVMATILEYIRSLLTILIPKMGDATKRQMLSLFSLVTATTLVTTPLAAADPQGPVVIIVKSASPTFYSAEGQNVTYTYNVTNIGTEPITGPIKVTDDRINNGTPFNVSIQDLAVNASVIGTANYTITQADINAGSVTNNATVIGIYNGNETNLNSTSATILYVAHLKIVKSASPKFYSEVGQNVTYTYNVTNDGNVTLTGPITVTDDRINNGTPFNISNESLAVNASVIGTANYTITQADINAGSVTNNATATGIYNGSNTNSTTVNAAGIYNGSNINSTPTNATVLYEAHLKIVKTASPETYDTVGQNVTYTYNVTNDGNVTLTGPITVTDDRINNGTPFNVSIQDLAVNASVNGTANYTITQADINAGSVTNNATATGIYNGSNINSTTVNATVTAIQNPELTITKSADPDTYERVGQNVTYTYNVTNTGNVPIKGPITVTDNKIGTFQISPDDLAPGQSVIGTANYTITRDDINAGSVTNNATATGALGTSSNSTAVNSDPVTTTITPKRTEDYNPHCSIAKSIINPDAEGDCIVNSPGDKIPYRIVVTNDGNVDLTGVSVVDPMISLTGPTGDDNDPGIFDPGETWVYDGIYTLTQDDINNGDEINNIATVISDQLPDESSSVSQPIEQKVDLSIQKSIEGIDEAGDFMINKPGDIINYQIAVENNGDVNLHHVHVTDSLIDDLSGPTGDTTDRGVLNPGETWVYKGDYTVTQADIDSNGDGTGYITNLATVKCDEHSSESSVMMAPVIQSSNFGTDTNSGSDNTSDGSNSNTPTTDATPTSSSSSGGSSHNSGGSIGAANVVSSSGSTDSTGTANITQPENNNSGLEQSSTPANVQTPEPKATTTPVEQSKKTPGFETIFGITALLGAVYLYRRR